MNHLLHANKVLFSQNTLQSLSYLASTYLLLKLQN